MFELSKFSTILWHANQGNSEINQKIFVCVSVGGEVDATHCSATKDGIRFQMFSLRKSERTYQPYEVLHLK